jgi:flagellar hook-basal body complex protein FliE
MDALSSLKLMAPQYDLTARTIGAQANPAVSKPIPAQEMQGINPPITLQPPVQTQPTYSFENVLGNMVNEVSQKQAAASDAVTGLLSGQNVPLHQAMISMEEASVSFQMMVEVRNKLIDSYQELMRMQI